MSDKIEKVTTTKFRASGYDFTTEKEAAAYLEKKEKDAVIKSETEEFLSREIETVKQSMRSLKENCAAIWKACDVAMNRNADVIEYHRRLHKSACDYCPMQSEIEKQKGDCDVFCSDEVNPGNWDI